MKYYALSDKGLCRNENQDNYGSIGNGRVFFTVVCDGMGGAVGGKLAAELAVAAALESVRCAIGADETGTHSEPRPLNDFEVRRILRGALDAANAAVYQRASEDSELRGMGTTVVSLFVYYGKAYVMHVGDSRLYLFREGRLHRVTRDHSYVQSLVELGEITEEQAFSNAESSMYNIEQLHKFGFRIAIDDFGTGYANYERLKRLQADIIKIDGVFVKDIVTNTLDAMIVRSITDLAKAKSLSVVAEFVETQQQQALLHKLGVQYLQGYLIGRPQPLAD